MSDRVRVRLIKLDTMKVRSNVGFILSTSPIGYDRISIEDLINPSVLLRSIKHPINPSALVWLIVIEFDQSNLTQWKIDLTCDCPIDHDRIIGSIEDPIDPSVLLWPIEHPINPSVLVWSIVIEFDQSNLTKWKFDLTCNWSKVLVRSIMIGS
jgi:hypothetical protein